MESTLPVLVVGPDTPTPALLEALRKGGVDPRPCAADDVLGLLSTGVAAAVVAQPVPFWRLLLSRVVTPQMRARVQALFARHGQKIVMIARFLPGVRAVTYFTAGAQNTLPLLILGYIRLGQQLPVVNAIAFAMIVLTVIPVALAQRLMRDTGGITGR